MPSLSQGAAIARLRRAGATELVAREFVEGYSPSTISRHLRAAYPGEPPGVRAAIFREGRREFQAAGQFDALHQFAYAWQGRFRRRDQPADYQYVTVVEAMTGTQRGKRLLVPVSSSRQLRKWELVREAQYAVSFLTGSPTAGSQYRFTGLPTDPADWRVVGVLYAFAAK